MKIPRFLSTVPWRVHFDGAGEGGGSASGRGRSRGVGETSAGLGTTNQGSQPGTANDPSPKSGFQGTVSPLATMLAEITGTPSLAQAPTAPTPPGTGAGGIIPTPKKPPLSAKPATPVQERKAEAKRVKKGRRATILTSGRGLRENPLGLLDQPRASNTLLGG